MLIFAAKNLSKNTTNKMKKSILGITLCAVFAGAYLTSCKSATEKVEDAEAEVIVANEDLDNANIEYLAEIENYRKESAEKFAANQKSIDDFNNRKADKKMEAKADYDQKIAELNQKNSDLKKRMDDYKAEGNENWIAFKIEFGRDMDELGKSFSDFFTNSK